MRHLIEYLAVRALMIAVRLMPGWLSRWCGRVVGRVYYLADRSRRRIAEQNLEAAFPHRSARERRRIVRGTFAHFGELLFEILRFGTLTDKQMLERVEFEGEERLRLAYAQGKGVLLAGGHFGFWEVHAIVHALQFEPIGLFARALDNPRLHALLEHIRGRTGNKVIYRQGTMRRVMRMLHEGHAVAVLIDQHILSREAISVDFFDRPAATTPVVAALAIRSGAPIVPVFALPIGGGRYRMIYEHPVEPPRSDSEDAIRELTQRCTDVLEMYVRRHPQLWLWMHRRWRETDASLGAAPGLFPAAGPEPAEAEGDEL